jgi:SAM-dependent methyltransferase
VTTTPPAATGARYDERSYGDSWAKIYDNPMLGWPPPDPEVDYLWELVGAGRALELGVGTGRVAIPLAQRGTKVLGLDSSAEMLAALHAKDVPDTLTTRQTDFLTFAADEPFDLVFCVGQTLLQLQTQAAQRRCLEVAFASLRPGGTLVVSGFTPDIKRFRVGQDWLANKIEVDRVVATASLHFPGTQQIRSMTMITTASGTTLHPNFIRYVWPSELLLLAELAGLELVERRATYAGGEYTGNERTYIVQFRRPERPS